MPVAVRPVARLSVLWALVSDALPIYPLYALLFLDTGLSVSEISVLFGIWSLVSVLAEIPTGALADRFSRRAALVAYSLFKAAGYLLWIMLPGFGGFAVGFVLWGLGSALGSGAFEALLYDELTAADAADHYARINGWVTAAELVGQVPAAVSATVLFTLGGYALAGWVSIGLCLMAAGLARCLPEAPRSRSDEDGPGYLATLRAGVAESAASRAVRAAVIAVAALTGLDALEEYFSLVAVDWGVPTALVPLALMAVPLAGAAGAGLGGAANGLRPGVLAAVFGLALVLLVGSGVARHPAGLVAVTIFYGLYRMVVVVADARLQERIEGQARATVTSVAVLGSEVACLAVYAAWAIGGLVPVAVLWLVVALALPWLLGESQTQVARG